jgi:hypothetical protein
MCGATPPKSLLHYASLNTGTIWHRHFILWHRLAKCLWVIICVRMWQGWQWIKKWAPNRDSKHGQQKHEEVITNTLQYSVSPTAVARLTAPFKVDVGASFCSHRISVFCSIYFWSPVRGNYANAQQLKRVWHEVSDRRRCNASATRANKIPAPKTIEQKSNNMNIKD